MLQRYYEDNSRTMEYILPGYKRRERQWTISRTPTFTGLWPPLTRALEDVSCGYPDSTHTAGQPVYFQRSQFQVILAEPQILLVAASLGDLHLLICTAHAPNSGHGKTTIQKWWNRLDKILKDNVRGRYIILCIDANNQLPESQPNVGCYGPISTEEDPRPFHDLLYAQELFVPSTFERIHQGESCTWTSNDGMMSKRLDYIAIPLVWSNMTLSTFVDYDIHSGVGGIDHFALCMNLDGLLCRAQPKVTPIQFDRSLIAHATTEQWQSFFASWPTVAWNTDPTTHAGIIEDEIQRRLVAHFPKTGQTKKNTLQFSRKTWRLFQDRNRFRKLLAGHGRALTALTMNRTLHAWKSFTVLHAWTPRDIVYAMRMAVMLNKLKTTQTLLRGQVRQDRADFLQKTMEPLANTDRTGVMHVLKHYRLGKRVKDMNRRHLPMVELENGQLAKDPQEAMNRWRRHYAQMEGGTEVTQEQLQMDEASAPRHIPCDLKDLPTLTELERQLRAAKPGKAMGMDRIPSELLHYAPQRLAHAVWPLFLKQALTINECVQHKGGKLISAFKRRGSITQCENHRALLVSSCLGKAFHGTYRARTMPYVHSAAAPMQFTSHRHPMVTMAAHAARSHLQGMKRIGHSAFALFLDITHAFYRVLRQFAIGATCSDEHVMAFLKRMGVEKYALDDIATMMESGPSLQQHQAPDFLHAHVTELHRNTWFVLTNDQTIIKTEKGTRPGDGFADVLWSLVFSQWMQTLQQRLEDSGSFAPRLWNQQTGIFADTGSFQVPHANIAWADDVVILGEDADPQRLVDKLQFGCSVMVQELVKYGLQPNFKDGKTEAIVDPRGKNSVQVRRQIFQEQKARLQLDTPLPSQPTLKLVPAYKHLGGLLTHGSRLQAELKHRIAQGHSAYQTYRTKIYANIKLDLLTKMTVLRSTSLTAMHYNAGTWTGFTQKDLHTWHAGHMNLYRKVLQSQMSVEKARHLHDDEVLMMLDEPSPAEHLRTLRLRWYGLALQHDNDSFWAILATEKTWLALIGEDMTWLYDQIKGYTVLPDPSHEPITWHLLIQQEPKRWKGLIKRAQGHAKLQRRVHCHVAQYHRRILDIIGQHVKDIPRSVQQEVERGFFCFGCKRTFPTLASWGVHAFKKHGRVNKWRRLQSGQVCKACGNWYPSEQRLLRHLQFNPTCAQTLASQQLWVEPNPGIGSKQVNQEEQSLALATWTPTPQPCLDRGHGWVMMAEVRRVLQWCTTRDWRLQETPTELRIQLEKSPIHEGELEEIRQALFHTTPHEQLQAMDEVFMHMKDIARPQQAQLQRTLTLQECMAALTQSTPPKVEQVQRLPTRCRYVLHLFAGIRRQGDLHSVVAALPAVSGVTMFVASIDIVLSTTHGDIMCKEVQHKWLQASREGAIFAVVCGPPCESWSVARWHDDEDYVGPKPLRSGEDVAHGIWALTTLRQRDLRQVDTANQLLLFSLMLFVTQLLAGAIAIIEHPICPKRKPKGQPASIWLLPLIAYLRTLAAVVSLDIWQGHFNAVSPKPTTLLITAPKITHREVDQWTRKHRTQQFLPPPLKMGPTASGIFATAPLKRYPQAFCEAIAEILQQVALREQHCRASHDTYYPIFVELENLYKNSGSTHDGADYVAPPPKNKH